MRIAYEEMMEAYYALKQEVKRKDKSLYERWKAGGFCIDEDIVSMYPTLGQVVEDLEPLEEDCSHRDWENWGSERRCIDCGTIFENGVDGASEVDHVAAVIEDLSHTYDELNDGSLDEAIRGFVKVPTGVPHSEAYKSVRRDVVDFLYRRRQR